MAHPFAFSAKGWDYVERGCNGVFESDGYALLLGTTNYLYDGYNDVEEVDNAGNVVARYTQGRHIDEPFAELRSGTTSYYEEDGLDAITSLTSSAGAIANTYTYDSFGKLAASTGTLVSPFQYTTREFDPETGIYFYRARYYDQSVGRFISEDPIGNDLPFITQSRLRRPRDHRSHPCPRRAVFRLKSSYHGSVCRAATVTNVATSSGTPSDSEP